MARYLAKTNKVVSLQRPYNLSYQESRVIQALIDFSGNVRAIASDWVVERCTVLTHLNNAYLKTGTHSKTELVIKALREGIAKL